MSLIQVDVDNALAVLNKVDAAAQTYKSHASQGQALAEAVAAAWKGNSGEAMQEKIEQWVASQKSVAEQILERSAELRRRLNELAAADSALADRISGGGRSG